jgi:hypothetical protein
MSLTIMPIPAVPDETARITQAAFPHGTLLIQIRDTLGTLYTDEDFADLFPSHGQPAEAPWRVALGSVLQFVEGLTDRQAADAVRSRLDWKYALSLELPPSSQIQNSPSDPEARYGKKREIHWVGYKVHLTETCDPALPHLVVQATTTVGSASDEATLTPIHEQLAQTQRLPQTHLQHLLTATALNLVRLGAWLTGMPLAPTRESTFTRFMAQAA